MASQLTLSNMGLQNLNLHSASLVSLVVPVVMRTAEARRQSMNYICRMEVSNSNIIETFAQEPCMRSFKDHMNNMMCIRYVHVQCAYGMYMYMYTCTHSIGKVTMYSHSVSLFLCFLYAATDESTKDPTVPSAD